VHRHLNWDVQQAGHQSAMQLPGIALVLRLPAKTRDEGSLAVCDRFPILRNRVHADDDGFEASLLGVAEADYQIDLFDT
jgi:hypothetical protein